MTVALIAALLLACLLNSVFLDQAHRRLARGSERWLDALIQTQDRHREDVQNLLQRIQAPQAAVTAHHVAQVGPVEQADGMPMSDEEIAEQQERDRLISFIEAAENNRLNLYDGTPE